MMHQLLDKSAHPCSIPTLSRSAPLAQLSPRFGLQARDGRVSNSSTGFGRKQVTHAGSGTWSCRRRVETLSGCGRDGRKGRGMIISGACRSAGCLAVQIALGV